MIRWKSGESELCHDTKVVGTTLESPEEIRVRLCCDGDNLAFGEHKLIFEHVISCPSTLVAVEVDTSSQQQPRHTDWGKTTSSDCKLVLA
ncbi:unnamed protein product [Fusarium graminearum]|nr:unnamed protein product [Fusarium graminearum]